MPRIFESLKNEENFRQVRQSGKYWKGRFVRMAVLFVDEKIRVGVSVSKKVNNKAVVRNKIRRRIVNILDKGLVEYSQKSFNLIVSVLPGADEVEFEELKVDIITGLKILLARSR